ncbi:MAG: TPM domain-containing protein [Oleiphilaceae bacterium]|nr:TPM domain-containing protein [Oleiphilaceae bacterium]
MTNRAILVLAILLLPLTCLATYPPAYNEYVNDYANVIDYDAIAELRTKLEDVEYYSGVEISVVTLESYHSYDTGDASWEAFCTGLFNHWGVGNREQNNGVLFLIATEDRKIRIELGAGYPDRYDLLIKSIIDNDIAPLLKEGFYTDGVLAGVEKIIEATTVKVSFFEWYKWYILGGIGAFISLIIALLIDKKKNPGLFWLLLGLAGLLIISIYKGLTDGNRSEGFGGGSSDGGGASGDF